MDNMGLQDFTTINQPDIFIWARINAGLSAQRAAMELNITEDRLREYEYGTMPQIQIAIVRHMAQLYNTTAGILLMKELPPQR